MGSETCDYAKCENGGSLVERVHEPTGDTYQYCPEHDPLKDGRVTWQYAEAEDGE